MFITFEGLDGSGKTTQLQLFATYLQSLNYNIITTREPGGTPIGDQIRQVVHDLKNQDMHPHTEVLLYVASRAQLVAQVIRPHLQAGAVVLSDRYADSTLAYQGYGHGLALEPLRTMLDFATDGLQPDLTVYLDINVEEGLRRRQRAASQGEEWNRLDALALSFHQRVAQGYQSLIATEPSRWIIIDAQGPIESVQQRLRTSVFPLLPQC